MDVFRDKMLTLLLTRKIAFLEDNDITSIPSDIGLLTNLHLFMLCKFSGLCLNRCLNSLQFRWIPTSSVLLLLNILLLGASTVGNNFTRDDLPKEIDELCIFTNCFTEPNQ
jgi:hypothetical protein